MSGEREKKYRLISDGYTRKISKKYQLDVPSEIISIIFMFYFIKIFNIKHGSRIKVEGNIITNISDDKYMASLNTTVIEEWMDCNSYTSNIHTIKIKTIKPPLRIFIGIVSVPYNLEWSMIVKYKGHDQYAFAFYRYGSTYYGTIARTNGNKITLNEKDTVSLTLNLKLLSLSYSIFSDGHNVPKKQGILLKAGEIRKAKYKWAVKLDRTGDSVEVIDVYPNN